MKVVRERQMDKIKRKASETCESVDSKGKGIYCDMPKMILSNMRARRA